MLAFALSVAAALGAAVPVPGAAERRHSPRCGEAQPATATASAVRNSTLCLINAERERRGLARLRLNRSLARSAARHALDMARRDYFSHQSPDGRTLRDRVRHTGYVRRARRRWRVGETLAWGRGSRAAPRAIIDAWLRSRAHRRVLLGRRFRDLGIAMVRDAPAPGSGGVTYVVHFGVH